MMRGDDVDNLTEVAFDETRRESSMFQSFTIIKDSLHHGNDAAEAANTRRDVSLACRRCQVRSEATLVFYTGSWSQIRADYRACLVFQQFYQELP
jgi:hypothetical protein